MKLRMAFAVIVMSSLAQNARAYPSCPGGHCASVNAEMNDFCIENNMAGKPYLVVGPTGNCLCPCSCFAAETLISLAGGGAATVENLSEGSLVEGPLSDSDAVVSSRMSTAVKEYPATTIDFDNGSTLTVSHNHTFVRPNLTTVTAGQLTEADVVLTIGDKSTKVTRISGKELYDGSMQNLVVNSASSSPMDHLVVTNDVISGDFAVQAQSDLMLKAVDLRMDLLNKLN